MSTRSELAGVYNRDVAARLRALTSARYLSPTMRDGVFSMMQDAARLVEGLDYYYSFDQQAQEPTVVFWTSPRPAPSAELHVAALYAAYNAGGDKAVVAVILTTLAIAGAHR